jgi:hypothetical protein
MNRQIEVSPVACDTALAVTSNFEHFKRSAGDCHERLTARELSPLRRPGTSPEQ